MWLDIGVFFFVKLALCYKLVQFHIMRVGVIVTQMYDAVIRGVMIWRLRCLIVYWVCDVMDIRHNNVMYVIWSCHGWMVWWLYCIRYMLWWYHGIVTLIFGYCWCWLNLWQKSCQNFNIQQFDGVMQIWCCRFLVHHQHTWTYITSYEHDITYSLHDIPITHMHMTP